MKKLTTLKTLLVGLCAMGAMSAWGANALTKDLEVAGYEAVNLFDFQNFDYDGTSITSFDELPTLGVTAQNTVGSAYGNNNWYDDTANKRGLRLQSGGGRWIQFPVDIKADDYIIINGGAASETYEISMTNGTSVTVAEASDYLCFKATADATTLRLTVHRYNFLLQILIMRKNASTKTADYVINYKYDNETIATDEGNAVVGSTVNVESVKRVDNVKYILEDGEETSLTIASGSNTLDVNMRRAATWNFTVNAMVGEEVLGTIYQGAVAEGDVASYGYPQFILVDDVLYKSTVQRDNPWWGKNFTPTADGELQNISYVAQSETDIIFCSEAEDIEGATVVSGGNTDIRASNRKGAYGNNVKVMTLEPGCYKIYSAVYGNSGATITFNVNNQEVFAIPTNGNPTHTASNEFTVNATTDLTFNGGNAGSSPHVLDYVIVQKTGDVVLPTNVTVTVTKAGYATYCSEYALNLSGVEAYTATIDGTQVSFVRQQGIVAPGTGLLIKANAGDVTIPVVAEGAHTINDNKLVGVTTSETVPAGSFVLMNESAGVGFYKAENDFTVSANTAYIAALPSGARNFIAIDGEATAIKAIESKQQSGEIYNLAGQRVKNAQKGLYIIGGKKVVIK